METPYRYSDLEPEPNTEIARSSNRNQEGGEKAKRTKEACNLSNTVTHQAGTKCLQSSRMYNLHPNFAERILCKLFSFLESY